MRCSREITGIVQRPIRYVAAASRNTCSRPGPASTTSIGSPVFLWTIGMTRVARTKSASENRLANPARSSVRTRRSGATSARSTVTSRSAVARGNPWTATACAPNTYHRRPSARSTAASRVNASAAAGRAGLRRRECRRDALVRLEVFFKVGAGWPRRIRLTQRSAHEVGDAQRLGHPTTREPGAPVSTLGIAREPPGATRVLAQRGRIEAHGHDRSIAGALTPRVSSRSRRTSRPSCRGDRPSAARPRARSGCPSPGRTHGRCARTRDRPRRSARSRAGSRARSA